MRPQFLRRRARRRRSARRRAPAPGVAGAKPAATRINVDSTGRRVGRDAQQADVAVLDAIIPDIEGEPDRPEPEPDDRRAIAQRAPARPSSRTAAWQSAASAAVTRQKPATASVGARLQQARQHRIARPDEGAAERQRVAEQASPPLSESAADAAVEQRRRAAKPSSAPITWRSAQPLAGQQRRQQHDQQRPEIGDEARLRRRARAAARAKYSA